jgi:hypothetical protein
MSYQTDPKFTEAWKGFVSMRKRKKKPLSAAGEKRQMSRVEKLYLALNNLDNLIDHIHIVTDACWDNVFRDQEHFNKIIEQYGGTTIKSNGSTNSGRKTNGSNFFNYQKDSAYFAAAEGLRNMCEGFDFVRKVAAE